MLLRGEGLGVTRTPIREVPPRLAERGFVENRSRRCFSSPPVTVEDSREVYPMTSALEALTLRSADPSALDAALPELERADEQMAMPEVMHAPPSDRRPMPRNVGVDAGQTPARG